MPSDTTAAAADEALAVKGGFLEQAGRRVFATLNVDALLVYQTQTRFTALPLVPSSVEDWSVRPSVRPSGRPGREGGEGGTPPGYTPRKPLLYVSFCGRRCLRRAHGGRVRALRAAGSLHRASCVLCHVSTQGRGDDSEARVRAGDAVGRGPGRGGRGGR
eukprot:SAG22_NODE_1147_length_5370_cov_3.083855_7_plen_160_part_00